MSEPRGPARASAMHSAGRVAALLVLALSAVACRTPVPAFERLPPDDPRPERLLAAWAETAEARRSLRARARLAVDGAEVRLRAQQVVLLERPGRLRVEVKGLLNQTLVVLVIDDERYELLRADDGSYQTGDVHARLLRETAGIDLPPKEAIALLLGAPALEASLAPLAAYADPAGDVRIELGGAGGRLLRRARFDALGRLVQLERHDAAGGRLWVADYGDFADVGGVDFPHRLTLVTRDETRAEIEFRDVELNPELSSDLFRLRRPADRASRANRRPRS